MMHRLTITMVTGDRFTEVAECSKAYAHLDRIWNAERFELGTSDDRAYWLKTSHVAFTEMVPAKGEEPSWWVHERRE